MAVRGVVACVGETNFTNTELRFSNLNAMRITAASMGRCRLPGQDRFYCGRAVDAEEVVRQLCRGDTPFQRLGHGPASIAVCLIGNAGMGKSSLAFDVGLRLSKQGALPGEGAIDILRPCMFCSFWMYRCSARYSSH